MKTKVLMSFLGSVPVVLGIFSSCVSTLKDKGISVIHEMPETDLYSADIQIPVFDNQEGLNKLISVQCDKWFQEFLEEVQMNEQLFSKKSNISQNEFYIDWQLEYDSSDYISLLLSSYSYNGGANGMNQLASFTWNKKEQQLVYLQEILPQIAKPPVLETVAKMCRNQLKKQMQLPKNDAFLENLLLSGSAPNPNNYKVFTMTSEGINFYFEQYQVAPGSYGVQKVFIPYLK